MFYTARLAPLFRILSGTGGRLDNVAILCQRIEYIAIDRNAHTKQHGIGNNLMRENDCNYYTANAKEHDEMAGDHKGMVSV